MPGPCFTPRHLRARTLAVVGLALGLAACAPGAAIEVHQPDASSPRVDAAVPDRPGDDAHSVAQDAAVPGDAATRDAPPPDTAAAVDAPPDDTGTQDSAAVDARGGADVASGDGSADTGPGAGQDSDGDGLDDAWEWAAGDPGQLDWQRADSDGDGTDDGDEDPDGDGLSNLQELAAARLPRALATPPPHPLRRDLLVELDSMVERALDDAVLAMASRALAALPLLNADGSSGARLHVIVDERDLPVQAFDGSFAQRHAYLLAHGPATDDGLQPPLPLGRLVHVVVVTRRDDDPARGGDTLAHGSDVEQAGVFIYFDAIAALHPACGRTVEPVLPEITRDEALAATLAHELGHTLQLGHDTEADGGINYFNLMSLPQNCLQAQMRVHGDGNSDPALGATTTVGEPRFSHAAAARMRWDRLLSVDVADFEQAGGYEM